MQKNSPDLVEQLWVQQLQCLGKVLWAEDMIAVMAKILGVKIPMGEFRNGLEEGDDVVLGLPNGYVRIQITRSWSCALKKAHHVQKCWNTSRMSRVRKLPLLLIGKPHKGDLIESVLENLLDYGVHEGQIDSDWRDSVEAKDACKSLLPSVSLAHQDRVITDPALLPLWARAALGDLVAQSVFRSKVAQAASEQKRMCN